MLKQVCAAVLFGSIAFTATPVMAKQKESMRNAPREISNPYKPALECLAGQLTPEQRHTTIGVRYFADRTEKESFAPESSSGAYLSGGMEDALLVDLHTAGMSAIEVSELFWKMADRSNAAIQAHNANEITRAKREGRNPHFMSAQNALPDTVISGGFSTLDFGSSSAKEARVVGIGGGTRSYSLRYTVDARLTAVAGNPYGWQGGMILETEQLRQDVVGRGYKAGLTGFFGSIFDALYIDLSVESNERELIQYSQRFITSKVAYKLVSKLWGITACEAHLSYGDALIEGRPLAELPKLVPVAQVASEQPLVGSGVVATQVEIRDESVVDKIETDAVMISEPVVQKIPHGVNDNSPTSEESAKALELGQKPGA